MLVTIAQMTYRYSLKSNNVSSLGPKTIECDVIVSAELGSYLQGLHICMSLVLWGKAHGGGRSGKEEMKKGQVRLHPVKGGVLGRR